MELFGKTFSYWREKYGGDLIGVFVFFVFFFIVKPQWHSYKEIIKQFPTIGMCAFGFMLTFLGIILQGSSKTIEHMKTQSALYTRFIDYNKRTVILALVLSMYSYIIGYSNVDINIIKQLLLCNYLKISIISLFWGMIVKFVYDLYVFVRLFYILLKQ